MSQRICTNALKMEVEFGKFMEEKQFSCSFHLRLGLRSPFLTFRAAVRHSFNHLGGREGIQNHFMISQSPIAIIFSWVFLCGGLVATPPSPLQEASFQALWHVSENQRAQKAFIRRCTPKLLWRSCQTYFCNNLTGWQHNNHIL